MLELFFLSYQNLQRTFVNILQYNLKCWIAKRDDFESGHLAELKLYIVYDDVANPVLANRWSIFSGLMAKAKLWLSTNKNCKYFITCSVLWDVKYRKEIPTEPNKYFTVNKSFSKFRMFCSRGGDCSGQVPAPLVAEHVGSALSRIFRRQQFPQGQFQEDHAPQDLGRSADPLPGHDSGLGSSGPLQGAFIQSWLAKLVDLFQQF